ncbi:MAG: acetoacetate decarboxylase family protein, partial [Myxococcales bacterium]|nr:acetoacetate decarboxylase family protein [Myxococcales bacterium]
MMDPKQVETRVIDGLAKPWSVRRSLDLYLDLDRPAWREARSISIRVPVDPGVARRWLPPALTPADPACATFFVAEYPEVCFGVPYRESGVLLHARHHGEDVLHCAWMVVDDDTALILGRELLGFPKKLAEIDFELGEDGSARAAIRRRGIEVLRMEARAPTPSRGEPLLPLPVVNAKGSPSIVPGSLWRMDPKQHIHSAWAAEVTLQIGSSPFDPLDELDAEAEGPGQTLISDIAVPVGRSRGGWRGLRRFFGSVRPVGLVSHRWLIERFPF